MKKFVALLRKEKQVRMNGKKMTLTFCNLYQNKKGTILFPHLLSCLKKDTVLLKTINISTS